MEPGYITKQWLKRQGIPAAQFAKMIGCDQGNLSKTLRGKLSPTLITAFRIEQETGGFVPMRAWALAKLASIPPSLPPDPPAVPSRSGTTHGGTVTTDGEGGAA